jgi:hypothetical protein
MAAKRVGAVSMRCDEVRLSLSLKNDTADGLL